MVSKKNLFARDKWRWMVLFGSFLSFFIADGWSYTFPMLFPTLVEDFQVSRGVTSYVPALLYAIPMILSHLACSVVPTIGCKKLGIFGGVVICISLVLASMATSLWSMLLAVGVLTSVALVAMYVSAYVAVTYWFDDSTRGLATGIAVAGSGLGSMLFPHFVEWLMSLYAWRGMMLVVAGVCLHAIISGFLYKPFPVQATPPEPSAQNHSIEYVASQGLLAQESADVIQLSSTKTPQVAIPSPRLTWKNVLKMAFPQLSLLVKHKLFALYCVANFILYLWVSIPYLYIYDWALEDLHMPADQATWVFVALGIARTIGQLLLGIFVDNLKASPNLVLSLSIFVCAISVFLIPSTGDFAFLFVFVVFFGLSVSSTYVLPMLCMGELIGLDKAVPGLGVLQFFQGIATIAGSPLGGWIYDYSSSYAWAFYISGLLMAFSALLFALLPLLLRTRSHPNTPNNL